MNNNIINNFINLQFPPKKLKKGEEEYVTFHYTHNSRKHMC